MNIAYLLKSAARRFPEQPAITDARVTRTFAQWTDRAARLAGAMTALGSRPGDRVVLFMENCGEFLEVLLATWIAGLVAVPVNAKLHEREVGYVVEDSAARLIFVTPGLVTNPDALVDRVDGAALYCTTSPAYAALLVGSPIEPVERQPHDPAWVFYTSGTTGRPKGAVLSHRNLIFMSNTYYADVDSVDERDIKLHVAPMSHGSGLYALPFLLKGAHQVVHDGFDIDQVFEALERYDRVSFFTAPTMLTRLIHHPAIGHARIDRLRTIYYGGGPTYLTDLIRARDIFGPRLFQLFGQGETPMTITGLGKSKHADDALLTTCGVARTGVAVRVVDADDRDLPHGEIGEVITRSDCVMRGYWNNPEASADALRGGWLHTGDLGSLDDRGYLTLHDRSRDVIISGGTNIYPREVEEVLLTHPSVFEVSVVGHPHPDWGEEVIAFVVCHPGRDVAAGELDALCLDRIARFKRPKHIRFLAALPKNNYGKVLKTELRQMLDAERVSP